MNKILIKFVSAGAGTMRRAILGMLLLAAANLYAASSSVSLEGQNKGDTNWYAGNLLNWAELDYIPCRLHFINSQGNNQALQVSFEHVNGGVPGVQNLFNFTTSSNVVFVSPPTLSAPPASGTWTYSFTINILDNQPAFVLFSARLAAGSHQNVGSSLALSGKPSSMGNLQIHKPNALPGSPDLIVIKKGPALVKPGDLITYVLNYTNKPSGFNPATGVQLSDILPAEVTVTNVPSGGILVGNTLYWDLPNLAGGVGGRIVFQALVNTNVPFGVYFTNFAQILSAENDLDYADNSSTLTTATVSCAPPSVVIDPLSTSNCLGGSIQYTATPNGTAPLGYQWRKNGTNIAGATSATYTVSAILAADAAGYSVLVTNLCGSVTSAVATLTVISAATISCPTNKTVELGSSWDFDTATSTVPVSVVSTVTNTIGHCGITFDATRTWQANDPCGATPQCSQKVTVVDTTPPVIACPSTNKTVEFGTAWTFDPPTATDNSGTNTITVVSTVTNTAGHCAPTFDATRTWRAIDECGNSSQCSQTVTVVDTTAPVITCSNTNKTVEQGLAWTFDAPTATDTSGSPTITVVSTVTNTGGHCGTTFDATRTWQATDACGNSAQCSQTVNVVDTTAPVILCSNTNKTAELGTAWTFDAPTANDNSGTNTITVVSTVTNTAGHCGTTFDATRTWQATDACGNFSRCSQTVNVLDTTAPVIVCSNTNKSVEVGTAWTFDAPTATDNGGSNTITVVSTVTNTAGHCGNTFDAVRTWQSTDPCGNFSRCSQTVNVADTTAPIIVCSNTNKTVEIGIAWTFDQPSATDNSGSNTITVVSTVTNTAGHCDGTFDAVRTWQATDACGNFSRCSQTVNVVDSTPPVITCSNTNKSVELGNTWSFDAPTATDNSGSNIISIVSTVTNTAGHCDGTFDATRTWQATDACGNFSRCSQTVNVADSTAPVITCPSTNKTVELATAWTFDVPTATDNSGSNTITIVSTVTNIAGHCGGTFDAIRTWQATDACGNFSRCSQTVNVVDTTAPVIVCSNTNKSVELGSAWTFDAPTATDNSGSNTITIVSTVTNTAGHCDGTFDAVRTWQATDGCGNFTRCSQTVNIVDSMAPVIACGSTNKTVEIGTAWTFDIPTATDNSGTNVITVVSTVTNTIGHCGSTFDATRIWQATDACGNSSRCSQTVNVADTTAPVIVCSNTNKTVELGTVWTFDAPTATDNGGSNTITIVSTVTNTAGHCGNTFDVTRTWEATDACGNFSRCSQKVNVLDTSAPVITCINTNKSVELGLGWSFDAPTATDNSGSNTITIVSTVTNTVGHCGTTFDATRTWQATDGCGNFSRCTQTVNVVDSTVPVITCSNTNKNVELGTSWSFDVPSATDNSGSNTITVVSTLTNTAGHCGNTFDATRTWQATDACGNFSRCSQTVVVQDNTAPVITCTNTFKTVIFGTPWTFDAPTATDTSGSSTITVVSTITNFVGHCTNSFDATRTWQATDACGNFSRCSQTVDVANTTPPTMDCTSSTNKTIQLGTAWTFDTPPSARDNQGSNVAVTVVSTVTNTAGYCGGTFDATRIWRATDGCGNFSQCGQTVTVVDTTAPVIVCSNTNRTVELGTAWTFDTPIATDNSGSNTIVVVSTVTNLVGHCGATFDATRTWQATDGCSNFSRCSQTVTVTDTTAPVIVCSNTNKSVGLGTGWTFDAPTATDNSGSNTITIVSTVTNTSGHCGTTFDAVRTWQATDACGNFSRCSQTVNVVDSTVPVITCSNTNKTIEQGSLWSFDAPTATDNSGSNTITVVSTVTNTVGHCGSTFDATRTWQATDACGNFSRCSQTVNVVDSSAPTITCANTNKTVELGSAWSFDVPTATDNSGSNIITVVSTVTNTTGHCGNTFDATRTWQATDACGNSSRCSQTVNVVDTTVPVIVCANTNKSVELGTAWTFDTPTATDNSGSNVITVVSTVTNTAGHCGSTFDATRTWQATDACGNFSRCSQTVNVVDSSAPTITCSNTNKSVELGISWTFDAPTATDNSGSNTITIVSTVTNTAGHCGSTFDATRTWQATDACGNFSRCSQKVNVVDSTAPVITCGNTNKSVELGASWTFDGPTATDNSGSNTITVVSTVTNTAGHCGSTFDAIRTWQATDACGNFSRCSQTVVVQDSTAPVITCINTNKNVTQGTPWTFDAPTATDNSGSSTITVVSTVTNTAGHCGSTFDATRTWQATDACGNFSRCSQSVNVLSATPPTMDCTSSTNKTVQLGNAWTFDTPTARDDRGSNVAVAVVSTVTNTAGHCGSTFDATRTWRATDDCGNSSQCSQTVTVVDTTGPVIVCSNTNKNVELGTAWTFDVPTATDNSGSNTITVVSTVTNTAGHCGSTFDTTRTWQAADACGNFSRCSQTVNVVDSTAPVITCINTNKTAEQGAAWTFDAPTATDNSGSNTITVVTTVTNTLNHCGTTFGATRVWQATDACGNFSRCSQTVTVLDTTAPVIICSNTNKTAEQGSSWSFDTPTATDNSGSNTITVVSTVTNTSGHCGSTFDATRTWQATDACGNFSRCSQTVNVMDSSAPVITCANSNKTVQLGTAWTFDVPTATDNSGSNTITVVSTVTNTSGHCGSTFDATRTWQATDACGNFSRCSQTVNVVDSTAPLITCGNTNKTVELGSAWTFDTPTATDNSGSNTITVVSTVTNTAGHCGNTFDATRTWQATDACGNFSRCSQTVNVADTTAPVIICANTNKSVELGSAWTFEPPTASDNSGTNIITIISTVTNTAGHCGSTFDATRTWQATDVCGNFSRCSQTVNVLDSTAPLITCINTNKTVEQGAAWSFDAPTATDNSGSNTITVVTTVTNTLNHCGTTFGATRLWQATDACGNFSRCSQTVTVLDNTAPVITCINTNKSVELGTAWIFDVPTATDNSGSNTITIVGTVTNTSGHCGSAFDATRTWQATDVCGNFSRCSQTVNVVDSTAPLITCSNTNKTVELGSAWTFDAPTATDNSGSNTITVVSTVTNTAGHCGNTFDATRTWQAADACGNFSRCSQTVNVLDSTAPIITCANTNKTVELSGWSFDAPTASDTGGSNTITVVSTVTNTAGHCGSTFDATRTWQATDACGNFSRCSQTVNVVDSSAPVIVCSNTNKTVQLGSAWTFDAPTATDNSGSNTITVVGTVTNTAGHCGSSFDATRTWQATDGCGNFSRCSQMVNVVSTNTVTLTCSSNKTVQCNAPWTFDPPTVNPPTNSVVILSTVTNTSGHCGNTFDATRTWQVTDGCGSSVQCSQTVSVVDTTAPTMSCPTNKTFQLGAAWTFDTPTAGDNCSTAAVSIVSTVTNAGCGNSFTATRTWRATDACSNFVQCSQSIALIDTAGPSISILTPTNGSQFLAPAYFTLLASAQDAGGIAKVEFFAGTNSLGQTTNAEPYFIVLTNVGMGTYTLTARATDGCGNMATSAPVTVTVAGRPPLTIITAMHLNLQTGLFEQTVRVTNPDTSSPGAVRVNVYGLTNGAIVYNASGTNTGVPYVQSAGLVQPGSYVDFVIEYYAPNRVAPNPTLVPELVNVQNNSTPVLLPQRIDRLFILSDKSVLLEFTSVSNRVYYIHYSSDLVTWKTVTPAVVGNGTRVLWKDSGLPKTESAPSSVSRRFYRLSVLP